MNLLTNVGKSTHKRLNKPTPFLLEDYRPPLRQTPGRVQYYRAENEPLIPEEIKWKIRMPTAIAMRDETLLYHDEVQAAVHEYLQRAVAADFLTTQREVDLDLTLAEAEYLFNANDHIKSLAASGELQALHARCSDLTNDVETGYIKVMD